MTNLYQCGMLVVEASLTLLLLYLYISIPMLVVASRRLLTSVSSAIRFLFLDLTLLYSRKCTLTHMCFQT